MPVLVLSDFSIFIFLTEFFYLAGFTNQYSI